MSLNQGYRFHHVVGSAGSSLSVAAYMAERFPHSSLSEWTMRIHVGEVLLNDARVGPDVKVRAGSTLVWDRPPWEEEPTPQAFTILYADKHLVAVNKPSGLPTIPGGGFYQNTLLSFLKKDYSEARPLHRLGRATSGIVLFALDKDTASQLARYWSFVEKQYRALGSGIAIMDHYDIRTRIGEQWHPRLGRVYAANDSGKESRSVARALERRTESTLFEVDLHTGRPHQIRIHLASIGHALVGDPLYRAGGQPLESSPGLPGDSGYWLHAGRLVFEHPHSGRRIELNSLSPAILNQI
jgi:23S rRNA pseudouridine1911/1915/1917 synthase